MSKIYKIDFEIWKKSVGGKSLYFWFQECVVQMYSLQKLAIKN